MRARRTRRWYITADYRAGCEDKPGTRLITRATKPVQMTSAIFTALSDSATKGQKKANGARAILSILSFPKRTETLFGEIWMQLPAVCP